MSTTALDVSFLRALVLLNGFKSSPMKSAQATLLQLALRQGNVMACQIPAEITNGSKHLAGAACGALLAQELLCVTARVKSPDPRAKGRKLDVFSIPNDRVGTAKAWLRVNGYASFLPDEQMELLQLQA